MSRVKELLTAAGTLGCALGIGILMQGGDKIERFFSGADQSAPQQIPPAVFEDVSAADVLETQTIELTSAQVGEATPRVDPIPQAEDPAQMPEDPPRQDAPVIQAQALQGAVTEDQPLAAGAQCDVTASLRELPNAFLQFDVTAPCHGSERLMVHHSGIMFSDKLSPEGALSVEIPALSKNAVVIAALDDGNGAVAQVIVETFGGSKRVVLQWQDLSGFELHAREFGADYGSSGHIWREASQNVGGIGRLDALGQDVVPDPHFAEIYSFPEARVERDGQIDLSVEAEVTARNCGLDIEAQTIELEKDGRLRTQSLTLSMPSCDAIGDYLVLNNVLEDLKIAAR